jgi:hypothetical protein
MITFEHKMDFTYPIKKHIRKGMNGVSDPKWNLEVEAFVVH